MKTSALILAVLTFAPPFLRPLAAESGVGVKIQDARQDLSEIRHEIRANERMVRQQSLRERDELGSLQRLNRELDTARRDADTHKHNLGLVRQRLDRLRAAVDKVKGEEGADRIFLRSDLVDLYKARSSQQPLMLLGARSPFELQTRARYLGILAAATQRRVDALGGDLGQLDSYRREFDSRYVELTLHMREVESDRRKVERERAGKEALLRAVRGRKARAIEAVRELTVSADRLQGMLDSLLGEALRREAEQRRAEAEQRFQAQSQSRSRSEEYEAPPAHFSGRGLPGGLPWPVVGTVLARFGKHLHPVFHIPVFNRGIEIAADYGSPVRVVAAGLVDFAGELEGFGHLVVVDHGSGMLSVYGYGSRLLVRKGQAVRQGDVLEDVGEAAGSRQASLYFEIRRGVKAQDPLRYLARR